MGYSRRSMPWALILGGALVSILVLGPILISLDRTELRKAIIDSKGTALSYITAWSGGNDGEEEELEIGDDEDIDYDDYKDIKPGEKGLLDREKAEDVKETSKKEEMAEKDEEDYAGEDEEGDTQTKNVTKKATEKSFLSALQLCTDMVCIKSAHELPKENAKFNFPHFLIIGFQKAATTSLHVHLGKHDDALRPAHKEPEFFTKDCKDNPPKDCSKEDSEKYIKETLKLDEFVASKGTKATFESSTHVVRRGEKMAPALHKLVPWVKLVINVREPISRAASMLIHMKDVYDEGCLAEKDLGYCLHARSQIRGLRDGSVTYYDALSSWFTHWPADHIHVVQYEELTDSKTEAIVMKDVKKHIGLDPNLPKAGLTVINDRRFRIQPEGWKMKKDKYKKLIKLVEPDVESLLDLLEVHGKLKDRKAFLKRWTDVWDQNLASCDTNNDCTIQLS